jgi:FkbM family methyltransferase
MKMSLTAEYDSFVFETDDPIFQENIVRGTTEPYPLHLAIVKRYLEQFPSKNKCFIDIGAHIGTTALPYSRLFQTVHAYEPFSNNFKFLERNVSRNTIANCKIHNVGLYSRNCSGTMVYHGGGNSGCYFFSPGESGPAYCVTLDSQHHDYVDFLKLDTEGSELHVLRGAEQTLRKWKPLIQFETNGQSERLYGIRTDETVAYLKTLGYIEYDTSDPYNLFMYCPQLENRVYCFWTGTNPMSEARKSALCSIVQSIGVDVSFVTPDTLSRYILPAHPLHPGFEYLSEVHKADYLRTYFMRFYGGGYTDIKRVWSCSWKPYFDKLRSSSKTVCGYRENGPGEIANESVRDQWSLLIGNCAYICKPNTEFTNTWYSRMMSVLDEKYGDLREHPASHPRDKREDGSGYPIEWNELLGRIFHKVCAEQKDTLDQTLPAPLFTNYM